MNVGSKLRELSYISGCIANVTAFAAFISLLLILIITYSYAKDKEFIHSSKENIAVSIHHCEKYQNYTSCIRNSDGVSAGISNSSKSFLFRVTI